MRSHPQQPAHQLRPTAASHSGSLDDLFPGAGDHDQPYRFGRLATPRSSAPYPFNTCQYARLLVLRGRVQDGVFGADDVAA